jgi:hypothetical protein
MKNGILIALIVVLSMVGLTACSSSSNGPSEQALVEANVEELMSTVVALIQAFEPFPPAPSPVLGDCQTVPQSSTVCNLSGNIQDCGNGSFLFANCSGSGLQGSLEISGSVLFTIGVDWPSGTRNLTVTTGGSTANYVITFNGTDTALVSYSDDDSDADCTVDLNEPVTASCTLLE